MDIDPRLNGIHSLAEALKAFMRFHENHTDIFALKDSILRSHHALETLFKHVLYRENPVFLVPEDIKVKRIMDGFERIAKGDSLTLFDELQTTTLKDTIERLRMLKMINGLNKQEYFVLLDSINKLTNYRNTLQHFGISANHEVVARILGNVIPRSIDIIESILPLDEHARMIPPLFSPPRENLKQELEKIYPESQRVIDLLRYNYDQLIREAIEYFKGKSFENQILNLKITDHGKVGAGPYMPEIKAEGFLEIEADRSKMSLARRIFPPPPNFSGIPYVYEITLDINEPYYVENPDTPNYGIANGSFTIEGQIMFDKAEETLTLNDAEEKIAVLRSLLIMINIKLNYKSEVLMTPAHYNCMKILEAGGNISIILATTPRGYERKEVELIGRYNVELNETNAPFRFHAFRNPDGSLRDHYSFEWNINTRGTLIFN